MTYSLPVAGGYRTSAFGHRASPGGVGSTLHQGVDVGGRGTDWLVRSIGPGHVLAIGTNAIRGRWVAVRHDDGTTTCYQHLDEVTARGRVDGGTVLGVMGTTGSSTARHLHLEAFPKGRFVRVADAWASTGRAIDPEPYLRARGVDLRSGAATVSNPGGSSGGSLPDVDTTPVTPIEEDDIMTDPELARMIRDMHAAMGAGGATDDVGRPLLADADTVLGRVRTLPKDVWDQPVQGDDPRGGTQTHPARAWLTAAAYRLRQLVGE